MSCGERRLALLESFAAIVSQDICVRSAARYAVCDLIAAEDDKWGLFDLAMSDPFARALNRRALTRLAERDAPRASRHVRLLTALMLDIDHCKRVNDVHGHRVGDEDLPGRPGGEDSARVLPGTEPLRAAIRANRLRPDRLGLPMDEGKNPEK